MIETSFGVPWPPRRRAAILFAHSPWCEGDCEVDESAVDEVVYLDADGTEHRMPRDPSGRLVADAFQERSSIRELAGGSKALDQVLES
jgi:YD repeat-containing protein